jgi:hypothetical protein
MSVSVRDAAATPTATVTIDSMRISAPVKATRDGRGVRISFPFVYPAKNNCTGTVTFAPALWNAGVLLEGAGTVEGPCAEHGHQDAAFVFRRRP